MVVAQAVRETTEVTEKQSLTLVKNLLRIALYNISYIRGLFPEKYYQDKYVPALEMKIKKLVPLDDESKRLIDWMEKGVYDALQRKYLKSMIFAICEDGGSSLLEEYTFSFSYGDSEGECNIELKAGGKVCQKASTGSDVSAMQMKTAACKMVRTLAQLMRTLDSVPEKRTLLVKLFYFDDVTPEDYEPPFFRTCGPNDLLMWSEQPLKMKVGEVQSKHYSLALKVRSLLDPCEGEEQQGSQSNTGAESAESSESEGEADFPGSQIASKSQGCTRGDAPEDHTHSQAETQDIMFEKSALEEVKQWLNSRDSKNVDSVDFFAQFSDKSVALIEGIIDHLVKDAVLEPSGRDSFCIRAKTGKGSKERNRESILHSEAASTGQVLTSSTLIPPRNSAEPLDEDDSLYNLALFHALQLDYVGGATLQVKLGGGISKAQVNLLIERMMKEGFLAKNITPKYKGRRVLKTEAATNRLKDVTTLMNRDSSTKGVEHGKDMAGNKKGSTAGCVASCGSDLTRTHEQQKLKGGKRTADDLQAVDGKSIDERELAQGVAPDCSSTLGPRLVLEDHNVQPMASQDPAVPSQIMHKASMVVDPIHLSKRMRPEP